MLKRLLSLVGITADHANQPVLRESTLDAWEDKELDITVLDDDLTRPIDEEPEIKKQLADLANEAQRGCGLSYDLYVQKFSKSVEVLIRDLPEGKRQIAIAEATEYGYATADELQVAERELEEMGFCHHGIDPECCPLGCGDREGGF